MSVSVQEKIFPTFLMFLIFLVMVVVDGKPVRVQLCDTAGQVSNSLDSQALNSPFNSSYILCDICRQHEFTLGGHM